MKTWIVNTNSNTCYIYSYEKKPASISLLKTIQAPENKLQDKDIVSDAAGNFRTKVNGQSVYTQATDPKENHIQTFGKEITQLLNQERNKNSYDALVVISEPGMNGILMKTLDSHVKPLIRNNIQKNMVTLKEHELLDFLTENTRYPDS